MAYVEVQFELLKLISDFLILLISGTIATYAIAASFLGKEYSKTLSKIKSSKEEIEKELAEKIRSGELSKLDDIKKTIQSSEQKENELKNRVKMISLRRVVIYPNIFFWDFAFSM